MCCPVSSWNSGNANPAALSGAWRRPIASFAEASRPDVFAAETKEDLPPYLDRAAFDDAPPEAGGTDVLVYAAGDRTVANCSSCHSPHMVLPSDDPRSSVAATTPLPSDGSADLDSDATETDSGSGSGSGSGSEPGE